MALNTAAISAGIAALSISGVTVLDADEIPPVVNVNSCPLLFPSPNGFISGGIAVPGPTTFGPGMWSFERAFTYLYLHTTVGQLPAMTSHYPEMDANIDAILTALVGLDVAGVDVLTVECSRAETIKDPAGNLFYGCEITVTVAEKVNP